jgi:hypothetical protein
LGILAELARRVVSSWDYANHKAIFWLESVPENKSSRSSYITAKNQSISNFLDFLHFHLPARQFAINVKQLLCHGRDPVEFSAILKAIASHKVTASIGLLAFLEG